MHCVLCIEAQLDYSVFVKNASVCPISHCQGLTRDFLFQFNLVNCCLLTAVLFSIENYRICACKHCFNFRRPLRFAVGQASLIHIPPSNRNLELGGDEPPRFPSHIHVKSASDIIIVKFLQIFVIHRVMDPANQRKR